MTPDDLKGYDPTLYDLLSQVYADHHIPLDVYHAKSLRPGRLRPPAEESGPGEAARKDK